MNDRFTSALLVIAVLAGILLTVIYLGEQNRSEVTKLRQQIETIGAAQEGIRNEIGEAFRRQSISEASTVLQRNVVLNTDGAPFKGNANAPVTLIEFTDFESPDCARYARETLPQLDRDYIASGKLKYVFRSFPDEASHIRAFSAQQAADCAGEQGKFWQMHDRLFAPKPKLKPDDMPVHAQAIGLDRQKFVTCFDGGLHTPAIRRDIFEGQKNGVTSTPTFFLGPTNGDDTTLRATRMITGARPYSDFKDVIDALLSAG